MAAMISEQGIGRAQVQGAGGEAETVAVPASEPYEAFIWHPLPDALVRTAVFDERPHRRPGVHLAWFKRWCQEVPTRDSGIAGLRART